MEYKYDESALRVTESKSHLLSIIIPIYNAEKYLKMCVDSILQQTFSNFELLLIDDGSRDASPQICDDYARKDARCKVTHKENGGCSSARNLGISLAEGDLVAFVDADDYLDCDMYQILIDNLDKTDSDVSVCGYKREKESSVPNLIESHDTLAPILILTEKEIYDSITRQKNSIEGMVWNKVWKREVVGDHRYRTDVAINDDAVFTWETLKDAKQVCYCDLPMYHYMVLPSGIVSSSKLDNYLKGVFGYEIMMADKEDLSEECYADLCTQYIVWNVSTFERLAMQKNPDHKIYEKIKENIRSKQKYLERISNKYHKAMAMLITKNFFLAKTFATAKSIVKQHH